MADNPREPIYLSKEEVGEILVREAERRRFRSTTEVPQLPQLKPAVPLKTDSSNHSCLNYEDESYQELKTRSLRDVDRSENANIPNSGDKKQVLTCQPVISRLGQHDNQTKTTKSLESTSSNCDLPGGTGVCINSSSTANNTIITGRCTPKVQNTVDMRHSRESGCDVGVVCTDSCAVPLSSDRLGLDADATSAEVPRVAGALKKKKKTVTFSDNVELVASASDVPEPVDYMSYAASIGRQAVSQADSLPSTNHRLDTSTTCCRDSDAVCATDSSDEVDLDNGVTSSSQVRCSLCRQKWIELTDTYCSDCSFYLSKLQMSN